MTQILTEQHFITYDAAVINEAKDMSRPLVLRNVVLQRSNAKNQNGRVYPRNVLMTEVQNYLREFVENNRALGELDHPESPVVELKNVCSNIIRMEIQGDDVIGDIQILSTPSGNIVRELIKNNIKLGVSSRGVGSVKKIDENTLEVQSDYNLICFDIVSNPSTYGAYINESYSPQGIAVMHTIDELIYDFLVQVK